MIRVRESSYDLLRVISAFAVIMLHVSSSFLMYDKVAVPMNCTLPVMLLNHLVRFAVPCFLMLSGAFILDDENNADYKYFYKKVFKNIGITGVIFCLLYTFYNIARPMLSVFILNKHGIDYFLNELFASIKSLLVGQPSGHLWYLFTLIGLYLATPFVIRFAVDLRRGGVNLYGKITIVFLILASVSYITSEHKLKWDIGWQICFLSYFPMGYKLRQWGKNRKNNQKALLLIFSGIIINIVLAYINYIRGLQGLQVDVIQYYRNPFSYTPLAPIEVVASCLIFAGFSVLDIKREYSKLAGYTFLIYLLHAGVWNVISSLIGDRFIGNQIIEILAILIITAGVFLISLFLSFVYKRIRSHIIRHVNSKMYDIN